MPTVQLAVNKEIASGSYSIIALIMTLLLSASDCLLSNNHDHADVKIRKIRIIFWTLFNFNAIVILPILYLGVKIGFIIMSYIRKLTFKNIFYSICNNPILLWRGLNI
jgi:nitrate reductase NapE component